MQTPIEKAHEYIEKWEIAPFFEFLEAQVGNHEMISRLKKNFILGKYDSDLADQLRSLAQLLLVESPTQNAIYYAELIQKIGNNRKIGTEEILERKEVTDLDQKLLAQFLNYERVITKTAGFDPLSPHEILRKLSLAENGHLFKGTFLALGQAEQIYSLSHTAAESKFIYFKGTTRKTILVIETITGNLLQQYERMMMFMRTHIPLGRKRETNEDIYEIPIVAVREFIANAYVHRDYDQSIRSSIQVELFDDRLEIKSPGKLPAEIDLSNIHSSIAINPTVALAFWYAKYIERGATGITTAQEALNYYGLQPAQIEQLQKPDTVRVTIFRPQRTIFHSPLTSFPQLSEVLEALEQANYAKYFEEMDKKQPVMDSAQKNLLNSLRNTFLYSTPDPIFMQKAMVLAREVWKKTNF